MFGPRFSPIDIPWVSNDPDAPCCMCPDAFIDNCVPLDECPQHGHRPDFSLCHDPAAALAYRLDEGYQVPRFKSAHSCRRCGHWSEGDWSRAYRAGDQPAVAKAQREMDRGCCDPCFVKLGGVLDDA